MYNLKATARGIHTRNKSDIAMSSYCACNGAGYDVSCDYWSYVEIWVYLCCAEFVGIVRGRLESGDT